MQHEPWRVQGVGQAFGMAHDGGAAFIGADQRQHPFAAWPRTRRAGLAHPVAHILIDMLGRLPQRDLTQGGEVALLEIALQRACRGVGAVDAPAGEPCAQLGRGNIDQLDLVRTFQHAVRQRLGDANTGDAGHVLIEAFEVLDVQRRPHRLTSGHQLGHVLPPFGVAAAGRVRVSQLVDQQHVRLAGEGGVEVELFERLAAIRDRAAAQDGNGADLRLGLGPAVCFDNSGHYVAAIGQAAARLHQHLVCFANTRCGAEEHLKPASMLPRRSGDQGVWVGPRRLGTTRSGGGPGIGQGGSYCTASNARFRRSTFTRGSPIRPKSRPSVWRSSNV